VLRIEASRLCGTVQCSAGQTHERTQPRGAPAALWREQLALALFGILVWHGRRLVFHDSVVPNKAPLLVVSLSWNNAEVFEGRLFMCVFMECCQSKGYSI